MYGAIIGDIVGSRFEFNNIRSKDFEFFHEDCYFTDDSVMTIAVAKALHESKKNDYEDLSEQCVRWMKEIGKKYPDCGYGGHFFQWINFYDDPKPYNSFGNGSAMRTSGCGWIADSLEEALHLADRIAIMEQGILIQDDSPMNLYRNPTNDFVREFLSLDQLHWAEDGTLMKIVKKGE